MASVGSDLVRLSQGENVSGGEVLTNAATATAVGGGSARAFDALAPRLGGGMTGAVRAGGVVGGVAGASVGGRRESVAVGVIGAVVGGVIGNAVERMGTREQAYEIIVQLKNGERRSIVQAQAEEAFKPGDHLLDGYSRLKLMHCTTKLSMPFL